MSIAGSVPSARHRASRRSSITGVLIFCGIGFGLSMIAAFAHWLELPPPMF
jgi:hypothetical protein